MWLAHFSWSFVVPCPNGGCGVCDGSHCDLSWIEMRPRVFIPDCLPAEIG